MKAQYTKFLLESQLKRWYDLKDHPVQLELVKAVSSGIRFPVVPAGRRSGKTERFKRFLAKIAMNTPGRRYFMGAPTHNQVKQIFWEDMKKFTLSCLHPKKPSESDLIIFLPNETQIHLIGFDQPARFEGQPWHGGGIDEFGNLKEGAWENNIKPALDTVNPVEPDYRAFCWLLGVPEGLNFYYDLAEYAKNSNDPQWKLFHWKSAEILPPDIIEAAKKTMSLKQFRQEYEASFETAAGRIYEDYDSKINVTNETIQKHEMLHWMHDQNYTPLSSAIGVIRNKDKVDNLYLLDEIVLESAVSKQSALEFIDKFKDHDNKQVCIYGDPAGRQGEKHGHASDYTDIEKVLRENGWKYTRRVKPAAPAIKDRQNSVRAKICNALGERTLFVNSAKAPYCNKGLNTVQLKPGSAFQEDDKNKYQHITTAIGYCIDYLWPSIKFSATSDIRMGN